MVTKYFTIGRGGTVVIVAGLVHLPQIPLQAEDIHGWLKIHIASKSKPRIHLVLKAHGPIPCL